MESSKFMVSEEIADSIDEDQFDAPKEKDEDSLLTLSFEGEKAEKSIFGVLEKFTIKKTIEDPEYSVRFLVQTSNVPDFLKNSIKFDKFTLYMDGNPISDYSLINADIKKVEVEQDTLNKGSWISITYK